MHKHKPDPIKIRERDLRQKTREVRKEEIEKEKLEEQQQQILETILEKYDKDDKQIQVPESSNSAEDKEEPNIEDVPEFEPFEEAEFTAPEFYSYPNSPEEQLIQQSLQQQMAIINPATAIGNMISYPIFTGGKTEDANQHLKQFDQIQRDGPHDNYQCPPAQNYNYDQEPYRNYNQRPPQAQGYNYNQRPAPQQDNRPRQPYQNANRKNKQGVNNQAPRPRPPAAQNVEVEIDKPQTFEEPAIQTITRQQYKYQQPDNLEEQDYNDEVEIIPETEWKKSKKILKAIQAELQAQDPETIKEHDKQSNNQETRSFTQAELAPVQQKEKFHVEEQAEARLKQNLVEDEQLDQIEQPAEENEDLQWLKVFQMQELEVVLPKFCEQTEQKKNSVPEFDVEQAAAGQAGLEQKAVVKKKEEDVRQQRGVEVQNLVEQPSRGAIYPGQSLHLNVAGLKLVKRRGSVFLRSQDFEEAAQTYEEEEEEEEPHEGAATHDAAMEQ
ncbi:adenylate cyclase, terminal-differentiation specific-like [Selaginella moellendorffii]|uniref:adenylate cyclase, terminal-differentiation specific-like n=1 Tax=Selaginella moellendorffii TaxID=88036 RepID=UPI000D1C87E9|nr:adenylate cyclase, terminal-differentiation specific-like [Selaginella moellendorffii]|eukprot:XP_024534892.1 adenylate cyclase, terminal-differentiation specific-like [Selaginella moellendorffii]